MTVVKVIEIIGESTKSWEEACQKAVHIASSSLRNLIGVDVVSMTGKIKDGKITVYRATVKVAFRIEEEDLG
jgi:flavin-binding protein dodecin